MVSKSTRSRAYISALSQQLLVLGAVGVAMIPAAGVINLDVVSENPSAHSGSTQVGAPAVTAPTTDTAPKTSVVPAAPVDASVRQVSLTAAAAAPKREAAVAAPRTVVSQIEKVTGYGIVGLSWAHGENLAEGDVKAELRTETDGVWTGWTSMDYHPEDGPDQTSAEGKHARPGTGEALVGTVDFVQARLTVARGTLPTDLKLSVIDPGAPSATRNEAPAIDTARLDPSSAAATPTSNEKGATDAIAPMAYTTSDTAALSAGRVTPKPYIYSRAQWGADESLRDPSSLHYFEVHGGFVHHTVNSNNYTAADVPSIIRGIYAFHVKSRGWSDIGYNFLIDKFGRIWEGRYGGVDRPVVGAHAFGVNDYAFGVSAIGNYEQVQPSSALLKAEGTLFAWKLSLSGISASAKSANIAGHIFNSPIQGHRDAVAVNTQNQTECPGKYLYAQLGTIRAYAAADQADWSGRVLHTNLVGQYPSIVARLRANGQIYILPTGGVSDFVTPKATSLTMGYGKTMVPTPDVTGDGLADFVMVGPSGGVMAGHNNGAFGPLANPTVQFAGITKIVAVGDVNGDGKNDLIGIASNGQAVLFNGDGHGHFGKHNLALKLGTPALFAGAGALNGDGRNDLITVDGSGVMMRYDGKGDGTFAAPVQVPGTYAGLKALTGFGDFTGDGKPDLFETQTNGTSWVLPGNGAGGFDHVVGPYGAPGQMGSVLGAAVLTGHRYPDVVGITNGRIYISSNTGRTDLGVPIATGISLPTARQLVNVGDWDGDGFGDFMSIDTAGLVNLYRGQGNGHFYAPIKMGSGLTGWANLAGVGDVTGDGKPDLQVQSGSVLKIYPGRGTTAGFAPGYVSHAAIAGQQAAAGLWDGDGAPDTLYRNGSSLTLWLGDGPGGLYAAKALNLDVSGYNWVAGVTNARGSTHPDLFARHTATGELVLRTGTNLAQFRYLGGGLNAYNLIG